MARRYAVTGTPTNTASKTMMAILSTAAIMPRLYDLLISCGATPASQAGQYQIGRITTAGTAGSAVTPAALDPTDPAATASAGISYSAEPTYTSGKTLLQVSVNQQATWRWVAAPGGELVMPPTANNGLGMLCQAVTSAFATDLTMHYME